VTSPADPLHVTPNIAPAAQTAQPARSANGSDSSPAFRRLLESLEQLAQHHAKAEPVEDAESLKRAIEDADSGFAQAMDLRRALEDAFKTRLP